MGVSCYEPPPASQSIQHSHPLPPAPATPLPVSQVVCGEWSAWNLCLGRQRRSRSGNSECNPRTEERICTPPRGAASDSPRAVLLHPFLLSSMLVAAAAHDHGL